MYPAFLSKTDPRDSWLGEGNAINLKSVNILDVSVNCVTVEDLLEQVVCWAQRDTPRSILYVNAHCLNTSYRDRQYQELLNQADLVYPDGISVVWTGRFLNGCRMEKITGADWIFDFCELAQARDIRFYILAGKLGIAQKAKDSLLDRWPGLKIVGTCDGYFAGKTEPEVLHEIRETNPHVVFVGMGTPRQEKWLAAHRDQILAPVCWVVGALFDYVGGEEPRAPRWMNAMAMEWLWRLIVDPHGKWRRYLIGNPLYLTRVLLHMIGRK